MTSEYHCVADEGAVWSVERGTYDYHSRFLDVFDEVDVFCRVMPGVRSEAMSKVSGEGIGVVAIQDFNDPRSFLRISRGAREVARRAASNEGAFLLHAPGTMASLLGSALRRQGRLFAIEVVGDPQVSLAAGTVLSKAIASLTARQMQRLVGESTASRFVTDRALQRRYPPSLGSPTFVASDVEIPDSVFDGPLPQTRTGPVLDLGFVGMLNRPYKGLDVLLKALCETEHPHRLEVVGDGPLRHDLALWAADHGLRDRVTFLGSIPGGEPVLRFLASLDLFVQPSRTEGLPRALIEAMAVGLPCVGTPVGGIPEMLEGDSLVPAEDSAELAKAIDAFAVDPATRAAHAQRNRAKAQRFAYAAMNERQRAFRESIRDTAACNWT